MRLIKSILILSAGFFIILYAGISLRFGIYRGNNAGQTINKGIPQGKQKSHGQDRSHIPALTGKE